MTLQPSIKLIVASCVFLYTLSVFASMKDNLVGGGDAFAWIKPEYTPLAYYKEGHYPTDNNKMDYEKGIFRCDTFVQYAYKKVLNVDIPPNNLEEVPKHQWKKIPYKRNPSGQENIIETISDDQSLSSENSVLTILADQSISAAEKSKNLITIHNATKEEDIKRMIYAAMQLQKSKENFTFLMSTYKVTKDEKSRLSLLPAIRDHYVYFKNNKTDHVSSKEMLEVKSNYSDLLDQRQSKALLRRAIEDITKIYEPNEAFGLLQKIDSRDPYYRMPYLTAMLLTCLNAKRDDELQRVIQTMNGCELEDHQQLFIMAHQNGLLSDVEFSNVERKRSAASHLDNCLHAYMEKLKEAV